MCCVPTARRLASTHKANIKLNYSQLLATVQRDIDSVANSGTSSSTSTTVSSTLSTAPYKSIKVDRASVVAASTEDEDEATLGVHSVPSRSYLCTAKKQASVVTTQKNTARPVSATAAVVVSSSSAAPSQQELQGLVTAAAPLGYTASGKKRRKRIRKKLSPGFTAKHKERQFVKHNYHDHSNDDPTEYLVLEQAAQDSNTSIQNHMHVGSTSNGTSSHHHQPKLCGGPGNSGGVSVPFPFKLHDMLDQIEEDGFANVVSWQPHGRSFVIHDKKTFVSTIMPQYFNQTKLTSFQRQLNLYGYTRLSRGTDKGGYYHELFLKHMPFLCHKMIRVKCKGVGFKAASDPDAEPNFYNVSDNANGMAYVTHPKDYWKAYRPKSAEQQTKVPVVQEVETPSKQDTATMLIDTEENLYENSSHDESHNVVSAGGSSDVEEEQPQAEEEADDLLLAALFKNATQGQSQDSWPFRPAAYQNSNSNYNFEAPQVRTTATPPYYFNTNNCGGAQFSLQVPVPCNMTTSPMYANTTVPMMIDCFQSSKNSFDSDCQNDVDCINMKTNFNSDSWAPCKMVPEAEGNPFDIEQVPVQENYVPTFDSYVQNVPPAYEYPANLEPVPLPQMDTATYGNYNSNMMMHKDVPAASAPSDYDWVGFGRNTINDGARGTNNSFVTDNTSFGNQLAATMNMNTFNAPQEQAPVAPQWTANSNANSAYTSDEYDADDDDAVFKTILEDASGMAAANLISETPLNDDGDLGNLLDLLVDN